MNNPIAQLLLDKGPAAASNIKDIFDASIQVVMHDTGWTEQEAQRAFFYYAGFLVPHLGVSAEEAVKEFALSAVSSEISYMSTKAGTQIDSILKGTPKP